MSTNGPHSSLQCTVDHDLNALVQQFWDQEREQPSTTILSPDETKCEELFARTHERTGSGRYVVRLPFVRSPPTFTKTRKPAERLLTAMEHRCVRDPHFGNLYRAFMMEYEHLKHMELISASPQKSQSVLPTAPWCTSGLQHDHQTQSCLQWVPAHARR